MKRYLSKNRIFAVFFVMLFFTTFNSPVYGQEKTEEFIFTHNHASTCYAELVSTCEADGTPYGEITAREICKLCGAELHYYRILTKCSCGKSFDHTGYACMNSPYGSNVGVCTNYEAVEGTMHEHRECVQTCHYTEESVVAKVTVFRNTTAMTSDDVELRVIQEGGAGGTIFEENGGTQLTVSQNTSVTLDILYQDRLETKHVRQTIAVNNIDRGEPQVSYEVSPSKWTQGNCVITVNANDSAEGNNAVSGIALQGYSYNKGQSWTADTTYTLVESTTGEIWVKDNAGNVARIPFSVTKEEPVSEKEETTESTELQQEMLPNPPENSEEITEISQEWPEDSEEKEVFIPVVKCSEEWSENATQGTELSLSEESYGKSAVQNKTKRKPEEDADRNTKDKNASFSLGAMKKRIVKWINKPVVLAGAGVASLSGGILLLAGYYFLIGMGTVAYLDVNGKEVFLGKIVVRRKKGKWRVQIDSKLIEKCQSRKLVLYFPTWFAKMFSYQTLSVSMPKGIQEFYVEQRLTMLLLE